MKKEKPVPLQDLTMRDFFAAFAMMGMVSQYPCQAIDRADGGIPIDNQSLAGDAYDIADALMEERKK
jgi:hypothetical protein